MIVLIPIDLVQDNPWQTRASAPAPEYVKELALDIAQNGLMQNPVGRLLIDGHPADPQPYVSGVGAFYAPAGVVQLAFGHNRLAAYKWLVDVQPNSNIPGDFSAMPVDLRILTDEQMADYAWSENEKRRDHTPYERALAIQRRQADFGWTQQQIAEHLGLSRPTVTNVLRLLRLPPNVLDALAGGKITERVATSLLSLCELPASVLDLAEKGMDYYGGKPSDTIKKAIAGEITSDEIRRRTDTIVNHHTNDLRRAPFGLDDVVPGIGIQSPTCKACDMRLKDRNVCLLGVCFEIKSAIYRRRQVEPAGEMVGIPALEDERYESGGYTTFSYKGEFGKILQAGCQNLRVMYSSEPRGEYDQFTRVDGYSRAQIVCGKKQQFCTCLAGLHAAKTRSDDNGNEPPEAPDADALREAARQARRDRKDALASVENIVNQATVIVAKGLVSWNLKTWRELTENVAYGNYSKETDVKELAAEIAHALVRRAMPEDYEIKSLGDIYRAVNRFLAECGLEPLVQPDLQSAVPTSEYQQLGF